MIQVNRVLSDEAVIRVNGNFAYRNVGADMNFGIQLRYAGIGIRRRYIATLVELTSFKISIKHDSRVGVIFLGSESASGNAEQSICRPTYQAYSYKSNHCDDCNGKSVLD